jgi:hypothetical protein
MDRRTLTLFLAAALLVVTTAVYLPVGGHRFLDSDDVPYVTDNPMVNRGLSWAGARWSFTSVGYGGNWHPLTWLSHQLDVTLFGLEPGGHHLVNAGLHAAATVLLFVALTGMTAAPWPSRWPGSRRGRTSCRPSSGA